MGIVVPLYAFASPRVGDICPTPEGAATLKTGSNWFAGFNAPLDCLAGRSLAARFHAWRGNSGTRYVCSVFPVESDDRLGGLPEFDDAVVLAVGLIAPGQPRRIDVFEVSWWRGQFAGDLRAVSTALQAGAREWHVHLLAESADARRAMINDLKDR
jgi:hypothetical protein